MIIRERLIYNFKIISIVIFLAGLALNNSLALAKDAELNKDSNAEKSFEDEEKPPKEMALEEKLVQKISLDYKNADLSNILRSLSYTYDLNIITTTDIEGKVTITLSNIEVGKALEAILTVNGLIYTIKDEMIYVSKGDPEKISLITKVIRLKYTQAAKAQNLLKKIISAKGDIEIDESSNTLIVTDFPTSIYKVTQLVKEIDLAPRQVLIEAKIIDITSKDLAALGVKWDIDYSPGKGIFDRNRDFEERMKTTVDMEERSSSLSGGQLKLDTLTLDELTSTMTIDALIKDGKANLLASPSIAILNNKEARIVIGERYPYKERTQTATGTTETTRFVDIGVTLRVTPQINEDGYITMRIHPEVSSLYASLDAGPRITTREADTTVRIRQGETLVIAGLIKQEDSSSREKIPILGDIPILGFLFSRSEKDVERKELAIFITPKILRTPEEKAALSERQIEKEKVYVNVETAGELVLVEHLFTNARKLESGRGVVSTGKNKTHRNVQALDIYKHIFEQFPDSDKVPEAMYRAGMICYQDLHREDEAVDIFLRLISDCPDSKYAKKARKIYRKLTFTKKEIKQPKGAELEIFSGE